MRAAGATREPRTGSTGWVTFDHVDGNPLAGALDAADALDTLPGAVFVIDELGTIRFANERTADMAERSVDELVGTSVLEYVDEEAA